MRRGAVGLLLVAGLWLALCAEREGAPEGERAREGEEAAVGREIPAAAARVDRGAGRGGAGAADGGPAPHPDLAGPRALRSHRLRVVNWARDPALLYGSAGAEEVLLDTVPAADSALLELRIRVDSVVLRATSPYGTGRGRAVVRFRRGEPGRWEIPVGASR